MADAEISLEYGQLQREVRGALDWLGEYGKELVFEELPEQGEGDPLQRLSWYLQRGDGMRMGGLFTRLRERGGWPTPEQVRLAVAFSVYCGNAAWGPDVQRAVAYYGMLPGGDYGGYLRKTPNFLEMNVLLGIVRRQAVRKLEQEGVEAELGNPYELLLAGINEFVNMDFLGDALELATREKAAMRRRDDAEGA